MTALDADKLVERYDGQVLALTVKAGSTIYKGALVCVDATGYAIAAADASGNVFMGVALESGVAGELVRCYRTGVFNFVASGMAQADVGARVYVSDDATVAKSTSHSVYVGRIVRVDSATSVWVDLGPGAPAVGTIYDRSILALPVKLAKIASAGDVLTTFVPGFAGSVEKMDFAVTDPVTTESKAASLNLEIGSTNVTGGVVALTSAGCATLGAVIAGSAITGANAFTASDSLSVEAASVTAFAEGEGVLLIVLKHAAASS